MKPIIYLMRLINIGVELDKAVMLTNVNYKLAGAARSELLESFERQEYDSSEILPKIP